MNAELLARTLEEFLSEAAGAVVLEDGAVTFDLAQAKYSISGEHNKCLLHLWSGGAKYSTPGFGSRGEEWNPAPRGATSRPGTSQQTGNLSRARPPFSFSETRRSIRIRTQT